MWLDSKINHMVIYPVDKLIKKTRRIASHYRKTAMLPVTAEALHDATTIHGLAPDEDEHNSIDACYDATGEKQSFIVKGRVLFDGGPAQRIGRSRLDQQRDAAILALMDACMAQEILKLENMSIISEPGASTDVINKAPMPVSRFRQLAKLLCTRQEEHIPPEDAAGAG